MTSPPDQQTPGPTATAAPPVTGHGGTHIVAAARAHGVQTLFTLSGAHVFPIYDAAVGGAAAARLHGTDTVAAAAAGPLRLIDVRHEQTAVFAAEATGKLTRRPGFAAVTAGPGVTNGVSGIAGAAYNGSPLVVLGGRAPANRWGTGALQELDHPPIVAPLCKEAFTIADAAAIGPRVSAAFDTAAAAHRGPVFADIPMDVLFSHTTAPAPFPATAPDRAPDPADIERIAELIARAARPVLVIGGDVWMDGAHEAAARYVAATGIPTIANGMGRGVIGRGARQLVTRARSRAFGSADLVVVIGTPLDFRLGFGAFGGRDGADSAPVVHIADSAAGIGTHAQPAASAHGDLGLVFDALIDAADGRPHRDITGWAEDLAAAHAAAVAADTDLLASSTDPIHPARIYGDLVPRLADDAVVIGDGGDFVSFAGRYVEPARPGRWLDPGPYGCLGTGLGYAVAARVAHPSAQVVLLLGDGAAGFSLMDVDTLVRHGLPVVMVVGNNSGWALEKHPMRFLYGYDVLADLRPTRYDEVVRALGGAGETVERADGIGPALDRAFASGVPYLVNVMTDPEIAYPRSTSGV